MTEEEKELIKEFKEELNKDLKDIENVNDTFLLVNMHNIEIIVNLIEKQEKVIDEMAKFLLFDIDNDIFEEYFCWRIEDEKCKQIPDGHCEECIKQYFYRKVENNE